MIRVRERGLVWYYYYIWYPYETDKANKNVFK